MTPMLEGEEPPSQEGVEVESQISFEEWSSGV